MSEGPVYSVEQKREGDKYETRIVGPGIGVLGRNCFTAEQAAEDLIDFQGKANAMNAAFSLGRAAGRAEGLEKGAVLVTQMLDDVLSIEIAAAIRGLAEKGGTDGK